jgi:hypothetical protein
METEANNKTPLLDVHVIRKQSAIIQQFIGNRHTLAAILIFIRITHPT